jgi:hypothetical protein
MRLRRSFRVALARARYQAISVVGVCGLDRLGVRSDAAQNEVGEFSASAQTGFLPADSERIDLIQPCESEISFPKVFTRTPGGANA